MTTRPILITKPGFYPDITPEQYFAEPCPDAAFTNSGAKTLLSRTPADFADDHPAIGAPPERAQASAAMLKGDVVHQLALGKGRGYQIIDAADYKSNAAKAARDKAIEAGLTPVLAHKFKEAEALADILRARIEASLSHIGAARGLTVPKDGYVYETEVVIAWTEKVGNQTIWCRGMIDVWCPPLSVALDPKVTKYIYNDKIDAHVANQGWDMQATLYKRGIEQIRPDLAGRVMFGNLLMHPDMPHRARNIEIDEAARTSCQADIERAMKIFAGCMVSNTWPDFGLDFHKRSAPSWKMKERMERELDDDDDT
jgi:hypothetical protein